MGDMGDWSVVRSRKRKATQSEDRRWDRSRVSAQQGGLVQARVQNRQSMDEEDEISW